MTTNDDLSTSGFIEPETNEVLPRFTEIQEITSAGFNTIIRAKRYGRWWILKGLKEELRGNTLYKELLKKEFNILISMQHPGIVSGITLEQVDKIGLCIVMEWIDGVSLKEWLQTPHSDKERWRIALQIIDALEYIHGKQTAHRDLKPSNILITHNGQNVKLIDFGLSDTDSYATFKQPAGTIGYISPEQASSHKSDVRNDIFSLGCVLAELQLGRKYKGIIQKCKTDNDKRYSHVGEVRRALLSRSSIGWKISAAIIAGAFGILWLNVPKETTPTIDSQPTIDTLKSELKITTDKIKADKKKSDLIERAIAEGKRQMDEAVAQSRWKEITSAVEYGTMCLALASQLNNIWNEYPAGLPAEFSEVERESVKQVLATYYSKIYAPIYQKLGELTKTQ